MVRYGTVDCSMVYSGMVWCYVLLCGVACYGMLWVDVSCAMRCCAGGDAIGVSCCGDVGCVRAV